MTVPFRHTLQRFCGQFVACAILVLSAAAAHSGQITVGEFYQETTSTITRAPPAPGNCPEAGGNTCHFVFSPVPAGMRLIVTHVSCGMLVSAGDIFQASLLPQRPNGSTPARQQFLLANRTASNVFAIDRPTLQLFGAGDRPLVNVLTTLDSTVSGSCTIAGRRIPAP